MIRLFSPERFRDYIYNPVPDELLGNGAIVLSPFDCTIEAKVDDAWTLTLTHSYDRYNKYKYIEKNAILVVDCDICREQTTRKQAFRILEVEPGDDSITASGDPVAWESIYEVPINANYGGVNEEDKWTVAQIIANWNSIYSNKYQVDTSYLDRSILDDKINLYVNNSNLQEVLNGDSGNTIHNLYNTELVYDNYTYHLMPPFDGDDGGMGEDLSGDITVETGYNLAGIDMSESMTDVITRIIPLSTEGYTISGDQKYIDATWPDGQENPYPHVFAKYETYDIKFVDDRDENDDDPTPWTDTQNTTKDVKAKIEAKVRELSEEYLRKARKGEWNHNFPMTPPIDNNPHEPGRSYDQNADRAALPYGYLFYSYTDAIGVLTKKVTEELPNSDESYKDIITNAIKAGFKWCETTEIAGWDWRYEAYYGSEDGDGNYDYLPYYSWYQDDTGWFYGDNAGEGHYIKSGWVEDAKNKHYWMNAEGYWDPQWDDTTNWEWYHDDTGWWYGSKNEDGTTKNYAKNQWIKDTSSGNWYYVDASGYLMDGSKRKYWYGTEDRTDVVQFKYWKIGNYIYWLDKDGYADENLMNWSDFQWREDEIGYYYGDGKGHYLTSCWVEESQSKHYWVDASGYRDEAKTDNNQWCWHGDWNSGFWYGTKQDDEDEGSDDDSDEKETLTKIKGVNDNASKYTKPNYISAIKSYIASGPEHTSSSTIGRIETTVNNSALDKETMVEYVDTYLDASGYFDSGSTSVTADYSPSRTYSVGDKCKHNGSIYKCIVAITTPESWNSSHWELYNESSIPSYDSTKTYKAGNKCQRNGINYKCTVDIDEPEAWNPNHWEVWSGEVTKINYAANQYMYVSGNGTWYWFDANGYFTAAWMVDDDQWDWHQDSIGWWYGDGSGSYPTGQWMKIGGKWYFFDITGYADPGTDDFADTKTGDSNSATYDSNREGVGSTSSETKETIYDENREGVRAWIQDGFVAELRACIQECTDMLYDTMNKQLIELATADLNVLKYPAVSISINFNTLVNTPQYEKFAFLRDLYLGDQVYFYEHRLGIEGKERITGIKYDVIREEISEMTFQTSAYSKKKGFVKSIANTTAKTGTIIKYNLHDALEDGYGGYLKTGYGVDLTTL